MMEIENLSFPSPWERDVLLQCILGMSCRTWTARTGGGIAGYVSCRLHGGSLHIINLAVHPGHRRSGFATSLMRTAESWGERLGVTLSNLEVRESSFPARHLYEMAGYRVTDHLEYYYDDGEAALTMEKDLVPDSTTSGMAGRIAECCRTIPPVGVVLGSGLSWLAEGIGIGSTMSYRSIMGTSTQELPGHPGRLAFSSCGSFVFLQGRRHHYQGYSAREISLLPMVLADMGVRFWILTTSSGAVDPLLRPGDAVLFRDHVNFTGCVPETVYSRIRPSVYSGLLREKALEASRDTGTDLREGVFACVSGPAYETSAEIMFLQRKGISTVSMSTSPEALYLASMGMEVAGLSMVTNSASPGAVLTHEEVLASQERIREKQGAFMGSFLGKVAGIGL
jgi:purine-nucleoside phosphorylase